MVEMIFILIAKKKFGVKHHDDNIRAFNGTGGANNAVIFNAIFNLGFTTDACGVDKDVALAVGNIIGFDGISGGACGIVDHDAVFI